MEMSAPRETASFALSLLDLTNLRNTCDEAEIEQLCLRAQTPFGLTAAICIWPRFVAQARDMLGADHPLRIATAVNFPIGNSPVATVVKQANAAVENGAAEIDLLIPYRQFLSGSDAAVTEMVTAVRAACPSACLKVIIEAGELKDSGHIRRASELAIDAGADFIKTSTGKAVVNATLEAADIMLRTVRESGKPVGFEASGGVDTVTDADLYLRLGETIMGTDWIMPSTFRFGALDLLDDITVILGATSSQHASNGY